MGRGRKSVAASTPPPKAKQVAADATLLEKEAALEEPSSSSKRKRVRSLDESVAKALLDNFKGWPVERFDLILRNGVSLREAIRLVKVQQLDHKASMGMHFYANLRDLYSDEDSPSKRMKVLNDADPMDEKVVAAIECLINHKTEKRLMISLFDADIKPNWRCSRTCRRLTVITTLRSWHGGFALASTPPMLRSGRRWSRTWTGPWRRIGLS
jgi:hypothetical protein